MRVVFIAAILGSVLFAWSSASTAGIFRSPPFCCQKQEPPPVVLKKITVTPPKPGKLIAVTIYPGSLRTNIIRIGADYGWPIVVWNVPQDYLWIGKTTITAPSLQEALRKVLYNYPVQADFYYGNRVLAIIPRNLS